MQIDIKTLDLIAPVNPREAQAEMQLIKEAEEKAEIELVQEQLKWEN